MVVYEFICVSFRLSDDCSVTLVCLFSCCPQAQVYYNQYFAPETQSQPDPSSLSHVGLFMFLFHHIRWITFEFCSCPLSGFLIHLSAPKSSCYGDCTHVIWWDGLCRERTLSNPEPHLLLPNCPHLPPERKLNIHFLHQRFPKMKQFPLVHFFFRVKFATR